MGVRDIKILIYLILLLFIFVVAYFLIRPAMIEIKNKKVEIKTDQKTLEQKESTLLKFQRVSAKYKEHKSDIKKMKQILLPKSDPLLALIQLDTLASDSKMVIKAISFGELELSDKGVGVFPASITVKGTFPAFKDFLDAVAKNLNLMDVETISRTKEEEEEAGIELFSLKINIYTKEVPAEEKPPETEGVEIKK